MTEPIAIVGLSLKFPGGSDNEATFWDILRDRTNVATEWPSSRTKIDSFYHPDKSKLQVIHSREAHFLKNDPAEFDAPFFSITANEAMAMDPQQRMILEASYRALENAGIPVERVAGTDTAVYSATMSDDYGKMVMKDSENSPQYSATGLSPTIMANRVSWFFDFHGPSLHVDTACSGSLVALDLACKSLQNGDSSMALVAGSSLLLSPELSIALSNMNFLSPDSRCYSFDERANGYSRGEGVAVLAIKRLSDAIRDLDTIRAVIRGTGINQDGHTPGLTQPSMESQENLIRKVYQNAQLDFSMTRYVEAHGTGTALGDPIEMKALGRIFRSSRSRDDPLLVGSVKGNIGHLEGASGLAGIIKALLILEKGIIPPNANFERLNPNIDAEFLHVKVPVQCTPWPAAGLRRVSINSFGFGGTNGHVVLDDAYHFLQERHLVANHCTTPEPPMLSPFNTEVPYMNGHSRTASVVSAIISSHVVTNGVNGDHSHEINGFTPNGIHHDTELTNHYNSSEEPTFSRPRLLVWSAADENALRRMHTDYATYCSYQLPNTWDSIDRIAFTLSSHRSLMAWRSYALADSPSNLKDLEPLITKPTRSDHKQGLAFVFTGQGAQYVDMGIELLVFPTFRDTLQAIDDALQDLGCSWFIVGEY
ncbi:MAG: polyketide synthase [Bogoriella megaspora]|nr:MAG: polyketide synthase [Bogoriella megaspora]